MNGVAAARNELWMLLLLLAAIALVWIVARWDARPLSAVQRASLAALRTGALLLIAWMGWGWKRLEMPQVPEEIAILADNTQSMSVNDLPGGETRAAAMTGQLLRVREQALSEALPVALYFTSGTGPFRQDVWQNVEANAAPNAPQSPLGETLLQVVRSQRGRPTSAVVLISDGNVTNGMSLAAAAEQLQSQGLPLFIAGAGREEPEFDLELTDVQVERRAFVGDRVRFQVKLRAHGAPTTALVELFREDSDEPVAAETAEVSLAAPTNLVLTWPADEEGECTFHIRARVAEPATEEQNTANNEVERRITIRPFDLKVLLAWGYPHYEFRYIKSLLERELEPVPAKDGAKAQSQLRVFLQEADLEYSTADRTALRNFPLGQEELNELDVILLGDVDPNLLGQQATENLRQFVDERGGGLMLIAGERHGSGAWLGTPLAALLPFAGDFDSSRSRASADKVFSTPHQLVPTPLGRTVPFLQLADSPAPNELAWQSLPPIYWHAPLPSIKPGVAVLIDAIDPSNPQAPGSVALTSQYFGSGRVLFQATDETHRWRFRVGDRWFGRYWRQIVRHLGRRKLLQGEAGVELATDRAEYRVGEKMEFRVRYFRAADIPPEKELEIALSQNSAPSQSVLLTADEWEPGLFVGTWQAFKEGEYRWTLPGAIEPPSATFRVTDVPQELAHTSLARQELESAARLAGGKYFALEDWDELWQALPRPATNQVTNGDRAPVWNHGWLAAVVVGLLTMEWWCRRRWGGT